MMDGAWSNIKRKPGKKSKVKIQNAQPELLCFLNIQRIRFADANRAGWTKKYIE
jgi:hypothetical protein